MTVTTKVEPKKTDSVRVVRDGHDVTRVVGRWDRYMAGKEAETGGAYGTALAVHERSTAWAAYAREVFSKLYDSGVTAGAMAAETRPDGAEWVAKLHDQMEALPEWHALKERARRDAWACGVAAGEALTVIAQTVKPPEHDPQEIQDQIDLIRELGEGKTSRKHLRQLADLQKRKTEALEEHARSNRQLDAKAAAVRSALRGAAAKADQQIDEMAGAMSALGAGDEAGSSSRVTAPPEAARAALMRNPKLRKIMKLAGRMKAAAIQKQRDRARPGAEELCDVTPGADLSRLLPSELGALADPDTETLLYRRLCERSALTYELRGKEHRAEGPILLAVDESGSMHGAPDEWAKAVAMALMEIAARQGRPFAYVHFDARVSRVDEVPDPRRLSLPQLEELATYFTGGGTSIGVALAHCAGMLEAAAKDRLDRPWKRADVVLITDGISGDHDEQNAAIDRIHKLGGHLYSIFIGFDSSHDPCSKRADEKLSFSGADVQAGDPRRLGNIFSI